MDVGQDTARGDGDTPHELVELLIVAHGQLDVAGDDAGLLVVAGGVPGQLQDLGGEVLEHGGQVHGGTPTHAGGHLGLLHEAGHAPHRELQASLGTARHRLGCRCLLTATTLTLARHCGVGWGGGGGRGGVGREGREGIREVGVVRMG